MKIPYKMQAAVAVDIRRQNMLAAIARGLPRLEQQKIVDGRSIHIACYGPSLRDTWKDLQHPCISMSGATRFLADRGFIPDYHIDMDPRAHKIKQIVPPVDGVTYLIASVCAPIYFDTLKDQKIVLWHCVSSSLNTDAEWLAVHDPGQFVVSTGSNIGLAAIQIGGLLGYRHFEIHGMDGSFSDDGKRHADTHYGKVQKDDQVWFAQGKKYLTSKIMANGVAEAINSVRCFPIFCVFHGEGLQQSLIEEENLRNACTARQAERATAIRNAMALFPNYKLAPNARNTWEALCFSDVDPNWLVELQVSFEEAEKRRAVAKFNTGSISLEAGLLLKAICKWKDPENIIEVGTFIGNSTTAMTARGMIYTCDRDNDCLPSSDKIRTFPYQTSTQMLRKLLGEGVKADLFFFDGRLTDADIPLILHLSNPGAVYVFDDFYLPDENKEPVNKGKANVVKLSPVLPNYALIEPHSQFKGRASIAMLIPLKP